MLASDRFDAQYSEHQHHTSVRLDTSGNISMLVCFRLQERAITIVYIHPYPLLPSSALSFGPALKKKQTPPDFLHLFHTTRPKQKRKQREGETRLQSRKRGKGSNNAHKRALGNGSKEERVGKGGVKEKSRDDSLETNGLATMSSKMRGKRRSETKKH
jgi:hypothetical protein